VIDLPADIVLPSSNRNRISSMGRHRGGHNCLRRAVALIGALVGKIAFSPHKRSTSAHPVMGSEQLESFEHSDSQQQGSKSYWGVVSLGIAG
jgi:hypothetical protein